MKNVVLFSVFAMMAFCAKAQDSTALRQNFDVDDSSGVGGDHFPPGWTVFHVVDGGQIWKHYSMYGMNNSPCVEFNGYQGGADHANDAWMISPKLNLTGYSSIYLNFAAVYLYVGDSLHVKVSTNYSGTGSPAATGVTWAEPTHTGLMRDDSNNVSNLRLFQINLAPYISAHTYIGFEYKSTDSSGSRWTLDSITTSGVINTHVGVNNVKEEKLDLKVIGKSTSSQIKVAFNVPAGDYTLNVFDMVGRKVADVFINAIDGNQEYTISNLNLNKGMYIVKLGNESSYDVAKTIVE